MCWNIAEINKSIAYKLSFYCKLTVKEDMFCIQSILRFMTGMGAAILDSMLFFVTISEISRKYFHNFFKFPEIIFQKSSYFFMRFLIGLEDYFWMCPLAPVLVFLCILSFYRLCLFLWSEFIIIYMYFSCLMKKITYVIAIKLDGIFCSSIHLYIYVCWNVVAVICFRSFII